MTMTPEERLDLFLSIQTDVNTATIKALELLNSSIQKINKQLDSLEDRVQEIDAHLL